MKIVRVEWWDACPESGWDRIEVAGEHDRDVAVTNETVGFLFLETKDRIVVVQSKTMADDGDTVADRLVIPRAVIVKLEVLQE